MESYNVMVADDEPHFREIFHDLLRRQSHKVLCASTKEEAVKKVMENEIQVLLLDQRFPEDRDGLEVLRKVRKIRPEMEVIMLTAFPEAESNLQAAQEGAAAYLLKTGDYDRLLATVNHLLEVIVLRNRNKQLLEALQEKNARLEEIRTTLKRWNESLLNRLESFQSHSQDSSEIRGLLDSQDSGFLALSMIHEVNNQLQNMGMSLEMAKDPEIGALPNMVDRLCSISNQLGEVVNSYASLILFRPSNPIPFSVEKMLDRAVFLARWLTCQTDFRVEKQVDGQLPPFTGYESQMVSAFFNLLKAEIETAQKIEHLKNGRITVRASVVGEKTIIDLETFAGPLCLESIGRMLKSKPSASEKDSLGIGLQFAKRTLEDQGATVRFEQPAEGVCRFRVQLPSSKA